MDRAEKEALRRVPQSQGGYAGGHDHQGQHRLSAGLLEAGQKEGTGALETVTHKEQSDADTSGQLGPKRRVWGGSPTSKFSQTGRKAGLVKIASVATEALLAI